uniref:receptor protein serine/threonine kinase n=1 Tax=Syphacia muris TaxID=451379 RepID=A0A0N5AF44_9BILA
MQRTVARQVELSKSVGTGRFGEVWHGYWRGESVAVKLFSTRDEQSWQREVEIYETTWLRHPDILAYVASDNVGMELQLWLITEFHKFGSLYDYLQDHTVTPQTLAKMIRSISSGLSFLHFELENSSHSKFFKPAIAHRDIKSKNILVKNDLSCAIADFGLAVKFENGKVDLPNNAKCGTTRYLSPELLSDDYDLKNFESHKMSDVYAMGLVMWEILRRCEINGKVSKYEVPYFDRLPREPSLEEMKQCVLIEKCRPLPCPYWKDDFVSLIS